MPGALQNLQPQEMFQEDSMNEQEALMQQQNAMPLVYPKQHDQGFTKWQYQSDDVLLLVKNFLLGREKDENGEWVEIREPLMTKEGVSVLMGFLQIHMNKVVFLSNLSKDDVRVMAWESADALVYWLQQNKAKYKIDYSNLDIILRSCDHAIYCSLMKPLNDKERTHLNQNTTRQESLISSQTEHLRKKRWGIF